MLDLFHCFEGVEVSNVFLFLPDYAENAFAQLITSRVYFVPTPGRALKSEAAALAYLAEIKRLQPDLDIVISDNLVEAVLFWNNVSLSANFLWKDQQNYICNKPEQEILFHKAARVFGNRYFSTPNVREHRNFLSIDFIKPHNFYPIEATKNALLISVGTTGLKINQGRKILMQALQDAAGKFEEILVGPELLRDYQPSEMKKFNVSEADFSPEMYGRVKIAIVSPGLGTITNLLFYEAKIIGFNLDSNYELLYNCGALEHFSLGCHLQTVSDLNCSLRKVQSTQPGVCQFTGGDIIVERYMAGGL
jgi:hypothetical protein